MPTRWTAARRTSGRVALVVAVVSILMTAAGPALAATSVPPEVEAWFEDEAASWFWGVDSGSMDAEVCAIDADCAVPSSVSVGIPVQVSHWSDSFWRNGQEELAYPIDQWIAPVRWDGEVVGTVVAWRESPESPVSFASGGNDAELGQFLESRVEGFELLVFDQGYYLGVDGDGVVQQRQRYSCIELETSLAEYREARDTECVPRTLGGLSGPESAALVVLVAALVATAVVTVRRAACTRPVRTDSRH